MPDWMTSIFHFPSARSIWNWAIAISITVAITVPAAAADDPFFRAINLNGDPVTIDGYSWEGKDAARIDIDAKAFENQSVKLVPETDADRPKMVRSSRWGEVDIALKEVPSGSYKVWIYVWEDNDAESFAVSLNGREVAKYKSGPAGKWDKLGPWPVRVANGEIRLTTSGGAANISGIEVHRAGREKPTADGIAHFEKRIRPLLVKHCYSCHSAEAEEVEGGLRVDTRDAIDEGGYTGPALEPGNPDASLIIKAVRYKDEDLQMPPEGKLSDEEIAELEAWVKAGAPDPREATMLAKPTTPPKADHWSLKPVVAQPLPTIKDATWPRSPVDVFIRAKQEARSVMPAAEATREALIRRATFDFTGLPPTPQEIDAFLSDNSPDAFERVVDRLLAAPQYGERWGRHWLDVVRYADTAGDNSDYPIPQMYHYRDWVIAALNRDLPYDQFVIQQLAGDLLAPSESNKETADERRDRIIATGYLANAKRFGSYEDKRYPWHLTIEDTIDNLGRTFLGLTVNCARCHDHKFDPLTAEDYYALYGFFQSTRYPWPGIELDQKQRDLVKLDSGEMVYAVAESANKGRQRLGNAAIQIKGDPERPGREVPRRFISVLGGQTLPEGEKSSGRLQLARWIADAANPLTARVIVNRVWHYHFGRGIVATPSDFGRQGMPPTHPELLDYLSAKFVEGGWSLKAMHRRIATSAVYRQSTDALAANVAIDADNELLGHFRRRRLDAESLRDAMLLVSRRLDHSTAGPHPFPEEKTWKFTQHNPFKTTYATNRRGVYMMTPRIQRDPFLALFDGADSNASTDRRTTSTTSLQALYFLNAPFVHEQSQFAAEQLLKTSKKDRDRVIAVYRDYFGRPANDDEVQAAIEYLAQVDKALADANAGESDRKKQKWASLIRALWMSNEFVYIN
jgi:mono/diheme cytochrome c family protein